MPDHRWHVGTSGTASSDPSFKATTCVYVDQAGHTLFKSDETEDRGEAERLQAALCHLAQLHNREVAVVVSLLRS